MYGNFGHEWTWYQILDMDNRTKNKNNRELTLRLKIYDLNQYNALKYNYEYIQIQLTTLYDIKSERSWLTLTLTRCERPRARVADLRPLTHLPLETHVLGRATFSSFSNIFQGCQFNELKNGNDVS